MTRRASFFSLLFPIALLLANACSDDAMMTDTGPRDGSTSRIEIATGDIGDYTPFDGEARLVRGTQGGQHVWVSLRAWDLDTRPALIQLLLERDADGETVSIPFQVRLSFQDEVAPDAHYTQISGLALQVPNPFELIGERVTVRARVAENRTGGLMAESSVSDLLVDWDPDNPPGFRPGEDGGVPPDAALPGGDAGTADSAVADVGPDGV